jgi:hypothetical protein
MADKDLTGILGDGKAVRAGDWERMRDIVPRGYVCYRAPYPLAITGEFTDAAWDRAPWTDDFVDIEGEAGRKPLFRTRAKMLWDDDYFYVGARLEEPHLWGTLTRKNSIIFHDNDFEVFIDPDGDNHDYYEFEINALGTIWELNLLKPYKDGGQAIHASNIEGLKSAVHLRGTLNDPADEDEGWSVEIAFPWRGLARYNGGVAPPVHGNLWRVNFSRVEWKHEIVDGRYRKIEGIAEDNWVWSPQGIIDMHRPERWGMVRFSMAVPGDEPFRPDPTLPAREMLMEVYNRQKVFYGRSGTWAGSFGDLGIDPDDGAGPARLTTINSGPGGFCAAAVVRLPGGGEQTIFVDHESLITSISASDGD